MKFSIPPHIAWPAFVIVLFLAGTLGTLSMVWISRLDGGEQIIDDYYARAVEWDRTAARRAASLALKWRVTLELEAGPSSDGTRQVIVSFVDSTANALTGLTGTITLFRPQLAAPVARAELREDPVLPGVYRQLLPIPTGGLWDFELEALRDSSRFWETLRKDVP